MTKFVLHPVCAICEQTLEPEYAKAAKELHKEGKVFLAKVRKCSI